VPREHWLEHRIPPPVAMLVVAAAMWGLARTWPALAFDLPPLGPLAAGVAAIALAIELAAAWRFVRARTTVNPLAPERSAQLVVDGLNRYSRNPMYVGQALLLFAWALWLAHPLALLPWPLFPAYIARFQILPEERALAARFGDAYAAYRARVRRWL
jgi:protein-S-isoprenylcysteine O-methyltransferase Ste14